MALTAIEKVRLQTGDRVEPYFVQDDEIDSYLTEYNQNIRQTSVQVAQNILFYLGANPSVYRERTGEEEVFTSDPFKAYKEALLLYIKYPHMFMKGIMPYFGGTSKADMALYRSDPDNNIAGMKLPSNSNTLANFKQNLSLFSQTPIVLLE